MNKRKVRVFRYEVIARARGRAGYAVVARFRHKLRAYKSALRAFDRGRKGVHILDVQPGPGRPSSWSVRAGEIIEVGRRRMKDGQL